MHRKSRLQLRRYASLEAMKADEYKYWQNQPAYARMDAVTDLTREAFVFKGLAQLQKSICVETIDVKTGLKAAFIAADDLIAAKVAAGRPQDLADVAALRKSQESTATGTRPKRRRASRKAPPKPSR
jgi:hypothetical protein